MKQNKKKSKGVDLEEHSEKWRESAKLFVFVVATLIVGGTMVQIPGMEALGGIVFGALGYHAMVWAQSLKKEYYSKVVDTIE